jgi:hypothetical protein
MLIIHQRKSAGTSLLYTLKSLLEVKIATPPSYKTYNNRQKRFNYFEQLLDPKEPIISYHLHPTKDNYNWVVNNRIRCLILLRNPEKSFQAMQRHVSLDGSKGHTNKGSSEAAICEFYNNWLSLKDLDHIYIVHFEELIQNDNLVINEILDFYNLDLECKNVSLQKKRYTGVGLRENLTFNQTPKPLGPLTFKFNPHKRTFFDLAQDLYLTKYLLILLKNSSIKAFLKKLKDRY